MNDNVEKRLIEALAFTGYKVYNGVFTSDDDVYFVFVNDVTPVYFGDDTALYAVNLLQLHLYCPLTQNTTVLRKSVKRALEDAGFTYPSEVNATDEHMQHIVFEFESEEYIDA